MKNINFVFLMVSVVCIISAIVIGLLGIWSGISGAVLWKSFLSVCLLFGGAAAMVGVMEAKTKYLDKR